MTATHPDELLTRLRNLGEVADDALPLGETALLAGGVTFLMSARMYSAPSFN